MKSLCLILLFSTSVSAGLISDMKQKLRPYLVKYLGVQQTEKLLGHEDKIDLPKIPEIKKDAKSLDVYKKQTRNIHLKKADKDKYDRLFVHEIYQATLGQEVNDNELANWLNVLSQGASREGLYRSLVLGDRYRKLEQFDNHPSEKLVEVLSQYLQKFLHMDADQKNFYQLNPYSLKRIVVEKSLEVMDSFQQNETDLFKWYAVISSFLAKEGKSIWKNKIRLNESKEVHLNWAKNVPEQHLKSEIIIKLHKYFNRFI